MRCSRSAVRCYEIFLLHYNALLHLSLARNVKNFNLTTQAHYLWNIANFSRYMNPRVIWCYEFEDFMGTLTLSGKTCVHGSPMAIIGNKVLENYLLVFNLALNGHAV